MAKTDVTTCPQCSTPFLVGVLGGLCPVCVRRVALLSGEGETAHDTTRTGSPGQVASEMPLSSFGDYDLLAPIARGGMGVVYRARQRRLNREVALKMILSGQFAGAEEVRRFKAEAEAAGFLTAAQIQALHPVYP